MATYRSEVHIPVQKDALSFQDRQIKQWSNVEERMEERRKQWQDDFERMRQEFFVLKPSDKPSSQTAPRFVNMEPMKSLFETDAQGQQVFRVRFEVSEFQPEEVNVKLQDNKVIVNARHEEKTAQTSVSREYSRQVDIPTGVDQDKLNCLLSKDGVLTVEGPVTKPSFLSKETFLQVKNSSSSPSSPNITKTTSTTTSSSSNAAPSSPTKILGVATPVKNPIITDADGNRRMRLTVDAGEFNPEEIVVKTADRKLIVHAEHEERSTGRTLHKEFNKEYDLPDSVDPATIVAYLGEDKQLIIEAPLKPAVQRKTYEVRQSQEVQRVVMNKEGSVTIADGSNRPTVTIRVLRK